MANDDTPRRMTKEEAVALDQELLDHHPHLGRPTVRPVFNAIVADYWKDLVREKGSHEAADKDLLVRRFDHFNEIEKRTMATIRAAGRIKPDDGEGEHSFVKEIQRRQYQMGLYSRPSWMSNAEAKEIDSNRRSGVMRVAG